MDDVKNIILCTDDFGLSPGINEAILKLVAMSRISAVSCMVNAIAFNSDANDLLMSREQIAIGLHFNLTEGIFLSNTKKSGFNLKELLLKTHLGLLKSSLILQELNAQLDHFITIMGRMPDFIDGHQHVHQFPIIRKIILELYEQRLRKYQIAIRSTYPGVMLSKYRIKSHILAATGGKLLKKKLELGNIPHTNYFAGIYDFAPETNYRSLFRQWLSLAPSNTLIMCHPGQGKLENDPIAQARNAEFNYFASNEFLTDCHEYKVNLTASPKP